MNILLRNYIRIILKEDIHPEDLDGNKNPIDWIEAAWQDPTHFGESDDPFAAMKFAAEELGLQLISIKDPGSSRLVYMLDNDKVLKLAIGQKGLAQNELEAVAGQDPNVEKILARVLDYSSDFAWLISQRVTPIFSEKEFEDHIGITWNELRSILGAKEKKELDVTKVPTRSKISSKEEIKPMPKNTSCLLGQAFIDYIRSFLTRYNDMLIGDIAKPGSWGITNDGCLVLLDYGITKKKFDQLYKR